MNHPHEEIRILAVQWPAPDEDDFDDEEFEDERE